MRARPAAGAGSGWRGRARPRWCRCRRRGRRRRRGSTCGESPHTIVMPGRVRPCSGPMTWTMPWPGRPSGSSRCRTRRRWPGSASTWLAADRIGDGLVGGLGRDVVVLGGHGEVGAADLAGPTAAGRRRPGGSSPRGRGAGRCRGGRAGPPRVARGGASHTFWLRVFGCAISHPEIEVLSGGHQGKRRRRARQGGRRPRRRERRAEGTWRARRPPPACPGRRPTGSPSPSRPRVRGRRDADGRFRLGSSARPARRGGGRRSFPLAEAARPAPRAAAGRDGESRASSTCVDGDRRSVRRLARLARTSCGRSSRSARRCRSTGGRPGKVLRDEPAVERRRAGPRASRSGRPASRR